MSTPRSIESNPFIVLYREKGIDALLEALRTEPLQTPALQAATRVLTAYRLSEVKGMKQ